MNDIYELAGNGDEAALHDLLGILYRQQSTDLFQWVQKALSFDSENEVYLNYLGLCYDSYDLGAEHDTGKALKCYKKAAELGNGVAARNLAMYYMDEDSTEALKWAKRAYELGEEEAAGIIAVIYDEGIGVSVDKEEAFRWDLEGAEAGDEYAQNRLARKYLLGEGCKENLREALDWFRTAADSGSAIAADNLSRIYRSNEYLPVDIEESTKYAIMAAEANNPELDSLYSIADMYREGDGVEKNIQKALELYTVVADNGNVACMENVGVFYAYEEHGIPRNVDKAIEYFEKAGRYGSEKAYYNLKVLYKEKYPDDYKEHFFSKMLEWSEEGYAGAFTELGILYHDGVGVECDEDKGNELILKAADMGDERALRIISKMYYEQENPEAEKYLKKAIQVGVISAKVLLGRLYTSVEKYEDKKVEGIRLLREAADKDNDAEAMYRLAQFDERKRELWEKAAELGHKEALYRLTELHYMLDEYNQAEKWAKLGMEQGVIGCFNYYADMLMSAKVGNDSERQMAYTYYEKTAEAGSLYGLERAGRCYLYESGGASKNVQKAISYLCKAVEYSNEKKAYPLVHLGNAYSMDGPTKNKELEIKYLKEGIDAFEDKQDPMYIIAAQQLAQAYRDTNLEESSFSLLEKLVDEGFDECKVDLAICYIDGTGVIKDHARGKKLLEEARISSKYDNDQKRVINELLTDLLNGVYGTDSNISGSVNGGSIQQSGNSVSYRPSANNSSSSGGCYIATCVYGSYDCPNVWVLRRFRDEKLVKTFFGRAFVKSYYAVSPILVKWFGRKNWFKILWLGILNPFVEKLKSEGFSDQRYYD